MKHGRTILHVDLDAFYCAVEVQRDPSLAGKPLVVGGRGPRGVVASASYEARAYGIRSAMPSVEANRRCPDAVWVGGDHERYGEVSRAVHEVFQSFTPIVEGIALDEAFLDLTGAMQTLGTPAVAGAAVRAAVHDRTGLWACVGIGTSKLIAKLASKVAKPTIPSAPGLLPPSRIAAPGAEEPSAGVVLVPPGRELEFLHPLPVRAIWGIGPATAERLSRYGVRTVADLALLELVTLRAALGPAQATALYELARGIDDRPVEADRPLKSVGHEETYAADLFRQDDVRTEALRMSDAVAGRLRAHSARARTVSIKVRWGRDDSDPATEPVSTPKPGPAVRGRPFATITRSRTLRTPTDATAVIAATARELLAASDLVDSIERRGVRLLGVSVSSLSPAHGVLEVSGPGSLHEARGAVAPQRGSDDAAVAGATQLDLFAAITAAPGPASASGSVPLPRGTPNDAEQAGRAEATESTGALDAVIDAIRDRFGVSAVGPAALVDADGLRVRRRSTTPWGPG